MVSIPAFDRVKGIRLGGLLIALLTIPFVISVWVAIDQLYLDSNGFSFLFVWLTLELLLAIAHGFYVLYRFKSPFLYGTLVASVIINLNWVLASIVYLGSFSDSYEKANLDVPGGITSSLVLGSMVVALSFFYAAMLYFFQQDYLEGHSGLAEIDPRPASPPKAEEIPAPPSEAVTGLAAPEQEA